MIAHIDGAIIAAYKALNLNLPTAYEGESFKLADKAKAWAAVFTLPASIAPATLGVGGQDEHLGITQIDFNVPPGTGRSALFGYAQAVLDGFVAGGRIEYEGQEVEIESVDRSSIRVIDGWMKISLSIKWLARTTRPEI